MLRCLPVLKIEQTRNHLGIYASSKWRHNVRHGLANGNAPSAVNPRLVNSRCKRHHAGGSGSAGGILALWWNAPQDDCGSLARQLSVACGAFLLLAGVSFGTLLSTLPAIFLARASIAGAFRRLALLRLCAMTLILPVLVAVFGILSVYGRQGWLATLCQSLGLEWTFSPYGLKGILLAHIF